MKKSLNIKQKRIESGLAQVKLAEMLNVVQGTVASSAVRCINIDTMLTHEEVEHYKGTKKSPVLMAEDFFVDKYAYMFPKKLWLSQSVLIST